MFKLAGKDGKLVLPPVIQDRRCEVVDVNLGMNNQDTIANMRLRGAKARLLDLANDKLALMQVISTNTST